MLYTVLKTHIQSLFNGFLIHTEIAYNLFYYQINLALFCKNIFI